MSVVCTTFRLQSTIFAAVSAPVVPSVVIVPETVQPFDSFIQFSLYTVVVCADAALDNTSKAATANHPSAFMFFLHLQGQGPTFIC
jgi:hypothetical protein